MISRWQISAGEVTEWLPPLLYAAAVLASAWVLFDARRRGFRVYAVALWTLATLIYTPIVLPLYLITRIYTQQRDATQHSLEASTPLADTQAGDSPSHASIAKETGEQTAAAVSPEETRLTLRLHPPRRGLRVGV